MRHNFPLFLSATLTSLTRAGFFLRYCTARGMLFFFGICTLMCSAFLSDVPENKSVSLHPNRHRQFLQQHGAAERSSRSCQRLSPVLLDGPASRCTMDTPSPTRMMECIWPFFSFQRSFRIVFKRSGVGYPHDVKKVFFCRQSVWLRLRV